MDRELNRHTARPARRGRLLGLIAALGLLAGMVGAVSPAPAAAQDEAPYVYYAGTTEQGFVQIGGAWFSEIPPYIFVSREPGGVVISVHYILSGEVWFYEGTWQFVTTTPYEDCTLYEGDTYYISSYDPGRNLYANWTPFELCVDSV